MFEKLVHERYSCRSFHKKEVPHRVIEKLLDITRQTPSAYNLQPIHFVVVQDEKLKKKLHPFCLKQPQVLESSFLVLFAGDREVAKNHGDLVLHAEQLSGSFSDEKAKRFQGYLKMGFLRCSFWPFIAMKKLFARLVRSRACLPQLPYENMDAWLHEQAGLSCMTFTLAATSAGLSTCMMGAFDEKRVKKALGLPSSWTIPIMVAVGHGAAPKIRTTRLPLSEIVMWR